jgi:magnesium chelatase family protein
MLAITHTVAFEGLEAHPVTVECALAPGLPSFAIVGLPNKAVSEAKERVRAALAHLNVAMPSKRITINLSPADMPKSGGHFDLPIALSLLAAIDVIDRDAVAGVLSMGELSLSGRLIPVRGTLPAAVTAGTLGATLICPRANSAEAAWVGATRVLGAQTLPELLAHFSGASPLAEAKPGEVARDPSSLDLRDVRGQDRAKRALEIAAAGRHHLFLVGPPGSGKSMMARRLPTLMPDLTPTEALETSMVQSLAGTLKDGGISRSRPFRDPHHTASMVAIAGGGRDAAPGEVSLAHNGVLFMDEFPEYGRQVLETLRQPIETGEIAVARANAHVRYPCRFLLVAAANPCRCGQLFDANLACGRAPLCGEEYLGKISGPLMDRFDLRLEVPQVSHEDLKLPASGDSSATVAQRVATAQKIQRARYEPFGGSIRTNADCHGDMLMEVAHPDSQGQALLDKAAEKLRLSARGYHRMLRIARTIADLEGSEDVRHPHIAETIGYRLITAQSV